MSILITSLLTVWAIVAVFMIFVILMQRPKSEGLGAAFGGGVTENIFGAQTTNVLVKFTSYLSAFFFLVTFVLSILYAHESSNKSVLREELLKREATSGASPAATQSPAASAVPSASVAASPAVSAAASASPKKP
jgi:preprotein translocase subunit SecG